MIDIQTRLVLQDVVGLKTIVRDINRQLTGIEDPLVKFRNIESFSSFKAFRDELLEVVTSSRIGTKDMGRALALLEKSYEAFARKAIKNAGTSVEAQQKAAAEEAAILKERKARIEDLDRFISSRRSGNKPSTFIGNDPNSGIKEREQEGRDFTKKLKARLEQEARLEQDYNKKQGQVRGKAISVLTRLRQAELGAQDRSKDRLNTLQQKSTVAKTAQEQLEISRAIATEQNNLANSVIAASDYNKRINNLKSASLQLTEQELVVLNKETSQYEGILSLVRSIEASKQRSRKSQDFIIGEAKKQGVQDQAVQDAAAAQQERLSLLSAEQRLKVLDHITAAQQDARIEAEKLGETDRKHNELADRANQRLGANRVAKTNLRGDFLSKSGAFINADPVTITDTLLRDPAFVAALNKEAATRIGSSQNATFQRRQQLVAATVAARSFTDKQFTSLTSGGGGGGPPGGGPPGGGPPGGGPPGPPGSQGPNNPYRKATEDIGKMKNALDQSANSMNSFGSAAGLAFRRFLAFQVGARFLYGLVGLLQQSATEALNFEHELTKIQQTLDETNRGVLGLSDTIRQFARTVGVSAVTIAQGVRTFAQAGYDQIAQLEQVTSLISRIPLSTSFDDINQTVEGSIAILGQFGGSLNDLGHIFDVTNQFSKDFAIEATDIFAAVKRAGASFSIAGGNIEDFITLLSVLRETTRESGEVLGTFFKSGLNQLFRPEAQKQLQQLGINTKDTLVKQLTDLGKKLFSDNSNLDSLQIIQIVRSLVSDSRQFPRLIALTRGLAQDSIQRKIQTAQDTSSGSFIKDTEKRIDDFGVSLKRAAQGIIDLFNEIVQNPAIKQLGKDFADLTDTITKLIRVAGPSLPALFAAGTGVIFPTVRREIYNASRFIRGYGFGRTATGPRSPGPPRNGGVSADNLGGELTRAEEGFIPLTVRQQVGLGAGLGVTAAAAFTRKFSSDADTQRVAGAVETAGLAFTALTAVGINPLIGAAVGAAIGLNTLSDSIIKARRDAFDAEFKNIKGTDNRIKALVDNNFDPLLGGSGTESLITQIVKAPTRYLSMGINSIERYFSGAGIDRFGNSAQINDVVNSVQLLGGNAGVKDIQFAREAQLIQKLRSPSDQVGQQIGQELRNKAADLFKIEQDKGGSPDEINRRVRLQLIDYIDKQFSFVDRAGAGIIAQVVYKEFKAPIAVVGDELLGQAKKLGNALRLFSNDFSDLLRNTSDKLQVAEDRLGQIGFLSTSSVKVANVNRFDVQSQLPNLFGNIASVLRTAVSNPQFRDLLDVSTEGNVDEELLSFRQRLLNSLSLGGKGNDTAVRKFIEESFAPALVALSQISGKGETDIVKDLLETTDGFEEVVQKLTLGFADNGEKVQKLTDFYNKAISVINAQLDAQRRLNEGILSLNNSIFDTVQRILSLRRDISVSGAEQSQLISGRSNQTTIGQNILQGIQAITDANIQNLINSVVSSRNNLSGAFSNTLGNNLNNPNIQSRAEAAEALVKAQNDYAVSTQNVNKAISILETNLGLASKAADIFKTELQNLRGTVDSAGKTISGLERKDLQSIIFSIRKFADASSGFTNISAGLSKLNPKEFDFVQKGLEIFNNFRLPGGLSGADVLGDINKTLGVPVLASILRAASGGTLSQKGAEAQINKQIADALDKQQAAQTLEQTTRQHIIDLLMQNVSNDTAQIEQLKNQTASLNVIAQNITEFGGATETINSIFGVIQKMFGSLPQPVKIVENVLQQSSNRLPEGVQRFDYINNFPEYLGDQTPNPTVTINEGKYGGPPTRGTTLPDGTNIEKYLQDEDRLANPKSPFSFIRKLFFGYHEAKQQSLLTNNPDNPSFIPTFRDLNNRHGRYSDNVPGERGPEMGQLLKEQMEKERIERVKEMVRNKPSLLPYINSSIARDLIREDPSIVQTPAAHKKFDSLIKSGNNTTAPSTFGGTSPDQLVRMNSALEQVSGAVGTMRDTLTKMANAPALQMSLEVKPLQVNVNVSVPELLRTAGPILAQQVIDKIAPAISEAFGVISEGAKSTFDAGVASTVPPGV